MKRLTSKLIYLFFLPMLLLQCGCEDFMQDLPAGVVEEGKPVDVSINFALEGMTQKGRALTEVQEYKMNDLYIIILDKNGNVSSRGYFNNLAAPNHTETTAPSTYGTVTLGAYTGECYIYGFANVRVNEYSDVKNLLDAVTNRTELEAITATLASPGNVERNQASLLMSGVYKEAESASNVDEMGDGYCVIPNNVGTLPGKIFLYRLDSRIRFNITTDNSDITEFKVTSWRVFNVPKYSRLVHTDVDAVGAMAEDYTNSSLFSSVMRDGNTHYFEFYMPENRKTAKVETTNYADREKEEKDSDGFNTGNYIYAGEYSTFVEITANMKMHRPNSLGQDNEIYAEMKFTVHLGGIDGVNDYKSKRNSKYIYNVTVKGAEDIITEAIELTTENRPGAEGNVTQAVNEIITLDAHYHTFIISFTAREVQTFDYIINTPFNRYHGYIPTGHTGDNEDLTWIQFKRNTNNSATTLEHYGSGLITVDELKQDVIDWSDSSWRYDEDTELYYTVFVKEYYYDEPPAGVTWNANTPYWTHFVNQSDRYASLVITPYFSQDDESSYVEAKYHISQRAIQTYYSTTNLTPTKAAIGLEHINESGVPSWGTVNTDYSNRINGYPNTYNAVNGKTWRTYFDAATRSPYRFTADKENHGYSIKTGVIALSQCMSRNRDEDGDGNIDANEVKWYMPAIDQLVDLYIGAESLANPLFDANALPAYNMPFADQSQYHVLASNRQKLWAEEGSSFGDYSYAGYEASITRCVRNLGVSTSQSLTTTAGNLFEVDESTNVISMSYIDVNSIRTGFIHAGELAAHSNFSRTNLPYYSFKVAEDFYTENNSRNWVGQIVDGTSDCLTYSEEADGSDIGLWRMPNQRELAIMYKYDASLIPESGAGAILTMTYWKYNSNRYFGTRNNVLYLGQVGKMDYNSIRCVRDINP